MERIFFGEVFFSVQYVVTGGKGDCLGREGQPRAFGYRGEMENFGTLCVIVHTKSGEIVSLSSDGIPVQVVPVLKMGPQLLVI